jgi:hypothetical protein
MPRYMDAADFMFNRKLPITSNVLVQLAPFALYTDAAVKALRIGEYLCASPSLALASQD